MCKTPARNIKMRPKEEAVWHLRNIQETSMPFHEHHISNQSVNQMTYRPYVTRTTYFIPVKVIKFYQNLFNLSHIYIYQMFLSISNKNVKLLSFITISIIIEFTYLHIKKLQKIYVNNFDEMKHNEL